MSILKMEYSVNPRQIIQVRLGDLTQEGTDAIVNAANSYLRHGAGVAGAIASHGGKMIQEESDNWVRRNGIVPTGQVAVTGAGNLLCRYIIHAVGPVWQGGDQDEDESLRKAIWNSLMKAHEMGFVSIALPAISSGIFGFPKEHCASILTKTALDFYEQFPGSPLQEIRFTNIDHLTVSLFESALQQLKA